MVDQRRIDDQRWVDSRTAARHLGIQQRTLYAYVSRGQVRSVAGENGRPRLYALADLERLKARRDARAGHGAVAAGALRWGEPVLDSAITAITPRGPAYRGHLATDLAGNIATAPAADAPATSFASTARTPFENVAELLWSGYLPTDVVRWPRIAIPLGQLARLVPYGARPLDVMPLVLSVASLADPQRGDGRPDTMIARGRTLIPLLAACLAPELGAATVTRALTASSVAAVTARALGLDDDATPIIDTILMLLADHELNASSFAARVAASTGADPYACIAAALATVSGPLHGSASETLARLADDIGSAERVPSALAALRKRGESPPAFGHPLYPLGDPRTRPLLALARELVATVTATSARDVATARSEGLARARTILALVDSVAVHAARSRVATKRSAEAPPTPAAALPSVDVGLAALVAALGLPASSASGLFAVARSAGWLAHVLEQRAAGFLLRPRARYVGAPIAS